MSKKKGQPAGFEVVESYPVGDDGTLEIGRGKKKADGKRDWYAHVVAQNRNVLWCMSEGVARRRDVVQAIKRSERVLRAVAPKLSGGRTL